MLRIGCIADDFTGASDAASFLAKVGMRVLLFNGVPTQIPTDADAAVIALKTRTAPVSIAVEQSRQALEHLRFAGAERLYIKYCSTFDSTPIGNIGPVCDLSIEMTKSRWTVLCPSLPVNGRTVRNGRLYVNGVPLDESTMKDHPLTPMWDSRLQELMRNQSRYPVFVLSPQETGQGRDAVQRLMECCPTPFYVVPDYETDAHGVEIARVFEDQRLFTGGSGLLEALGGMLADSRKSMVLSGVPTAALVLAGSCSVTTRKQIECWQQSGRPRIHIDVLNLLHNEPREKERLLGFMWDHTGEDLLIDSSEDIESVRTYQTDAYDVSERIERVMRTLAVQGHKMGIRRMIVAGGETSGAVTSALGYSIYRIGQCIAPGVPVMSPLEAPDVRLVLKSGNFGQDDFFLRALRETGWNTDDTE